MYKMEIGSDRNGWWVIVEDNKIYLESEEIAIKFTLELLKTSGRIGY